MVLELSAFLLKTPLFIVRIPTVSISYIAINRMSYNHSPNSRCPIPIMKLQRQHSAYSLPPSSSRFYPDIESIQLSQNKKHIKPSLQLSPTNTKPKLGALISKFEALDASNKLSEIKSSPTVVLRPLNQSVGYKEGCTARTSPPRKLSTAIFSPRPLSTGRYENVFLEDESPIEKDDVFTCSTYKSIKSGKLTGLEILEDTPNPKKTPSFQRQDTSHKSNESPRSIGNIRSLSREYCKKPRRGSIRDIIKFYDGSSDLLSSKCSSQISRY